MQKVSVVIKKLEDEYAQEEIQNQKKVRISRAGKIAALQKSPL